MNVAQVVVTAAATLLAVLLGGWITVRAQDRLWVRDQQRQWRDIRLANYGDFLSAFREYVAYILLPTAHVTAVPRPAYPHDLMPFFDETGTRYKERLEATKTSIRLVSGKPELVEASRKMLQQARQLAAERATQEVGTIADDKFEKLWSAEREFVRLARGELGLTEQFDREAGTAEARKPVETGTLGLNERFEALGR